MKNLVIALAALAMIAAAGVASAAERTTLFAIKNMSCVTCPFMVRKSMEGVDGVISVKVSFDKKMATVVYDDAKTNPQQIGAASGEAGFPASPVKPTG